MDSCVSCIDYQLLNQKMIGDSYALSRIDELLEHLIGVKYFSSLGLRSGYYRVEIEEDHKTRTAFMIGPLVFDQFERMLFGLTSASATFHRLMELGARLFYAVPLSSAGPADWHRQISLHSALSPGSAAAFLCTGTLFN